MSKLSTSRWAKTRKKQSAAWLAAGLCRSCGKEKSPEASQCVVCQERARRLNRQYRERVLAETGVQDSTARWNAARKEAIRHYGGKCAICGECNPKFLTVDHIENDGNRQRAENSGAFKIHRWLLRNNFPPGYQILCWNHNYLKDLLIRQKNLSQVPYCVRNRRCRQKLRDEVFAAYGGAKCVCCGCTDHEVLTLDHIDGGGNKHRRELNRRGGHEYLFWVRKSGYPSGYQVMCLNCNCGRSANGGMCPHVKPTP